MDMKDKLAQAGIRPTAQRTLIAELVFGGLAHPSADEVFKAATSQSKSVSQATVYNTLNAFVEAGLLQQFDLGSGRVIYDCNTNNHHHFIDDDTGEIIDLAPSDVRLSEHCAARFDVHSVHMVVRGTLRPGQPS